MRLSSNIIVLHLAISVSMKYAHEVVLFWSEFNYFDIICLISNVIISSNWNMINTWQNLDMGFSCIVLKQAGSMPSLWNFAFAYFALIMSLKMNATSFSHVICIMTCVLHCMISFDRIFLILKCWTLIAKLYFWCHAMWLKRLSWICILCHGIET